MSVQDPKVQDPGGVTEPEATVEATPEATPEVTAPATPETTAPATPEAVVPATVEPASQATVEENVKVRGELLVSKVKELLHEGNVRRIIVKNDQGQTVMEIPVTAGLVVAIVAPVLTAVAAVAALASSWEIEVRRSPGHTGDR
jgi:uncharacterized protein YkwD